MTHTPSSTSPLTYTTFVMIKNMGSLDRLLRVVSAVVIVVLYFTGVISGLVAIILGVVAAAFLLTSAVGTCPVYLPFGLSTRTGGKETTGGAAA